MLGIIHCDRDGAPAFVFDMMEPERRKVDRAVHGFLKLEVPHPADFTTREDGVVRLIRTWRGGIPIVKGSRPVSGLGQRKRVAHIPTTETEAAISGLILEGQGGRDYTLNSTTRGPTNGVQFSVDRRKRHGAKVPILDVLLVDFQFVTELCQPLFEMRLGRFQYDAAVVLAQRRRKLPDFVKRIFE
jgi:hypothetical protein